MTDRLVADASHHDVTIQIWESTWHTPGRRASSGYLTVAIGDIVYNSHGDADVAPVHVTAGEYESWRDGVVAALDAAHKRALELTAVEQVRTVTADALGTPIDTERTAP